MGYKEQAIARGKKWSKYKDDPKITLFPNQLEDIQTYEDSIKPKETIKPKKEK